MVRCVETGMEFETVKQAGSALAALGLGKDAAVAAAAISNCMRTGGIYWRCTRCGAFNRKDAVTDCCGVIPSRCCANCGAGVVE